MENEKIAFLTCPNGANMPISASYLGRNKSLSPDFFVPSILNPRDGGGIWSDFTKKMGGLDNECPIYAAKAAVLLCLCYGVWSPCIFRRGDQKEGVIQDAYPFSWGKPPPEKEILAWAKDLPMLAA